MKVHSRSDIQRQGATRCIQKAKQRLTTQASPQRDVLSDNRHAQTRITYTRSDTGRLEQSSSLTQIKRKIVNFFITLTAFYVNF